MMDYVAQHVTGVLAPRVRGCYDVDPDQIVLVSDLVPGDPTPQSLARPRRHPARLDQGSAQGTVTVHESLHPTIHWAGQLPTNTRLL